MNSIPLHELVPVSACQARLQDLELELSGTGYVQTRESYQVPLQIEVVAKTDSTNLRLHFGKGQIILNWEEDPNCFVIHEPVMGHDWKLQGKGGIPINEWVTVTWIIDRTQMTVLVNGEERFTFSPDDGLVTLGSGMPWLLANYIHLSSPIGVGPAWGSTVTIRSVRVGKV
ncbi:hypothetical protein CBW65_06565 [Tumebacillus avium]|uniref:Uncharacterized protein n=1 Tax=Tumebacillus avium TaxID=1903704 RepID=A0A1Y0IJV0_9BACL|nr:hypothetical protein [Tumebacillus avium]ARU60791.1 hypothetical protein CBW65_06565 [Tumebacillus avium]